MVAKRGEMGSITLIVGNLPKLKGEQALGVENWALIVKEWAERLGTTPEELRLSEKAIDLDECGYGNIAALEELNARMLYKEFDFPMPVGKASVGIIKDILKQQDGEELESDAAKDEDFFSLRQDETPTHTFIIKTAQLIDHAVVKQQQNFAITLLLP